MRYSCTLYAWSLVLWKYEIGYPVPGFVVVCVSRRLVGKWAAKKWEVLTTFRCVLGAFQED